MEQSNCTKCIHYKVCKFVNNKIPLEDWNFMWNNFKIECKHFKRDAKFITLTPTIQINDGATKKVDIDELIKKLEKYMKRELENAVKGIYE
ncbi:hypothetical protein [Clostridium botulinum]|uniref:Putative tail length tape measure protein n=1 Tax=Clostridium botulinum CFSAN001627 TaxID=1232189 RepID=M1ZZN6_CLOBO|nr:hypothetical protein [Clostridium botulinum]EKN43090.1 putative tail length tape measure protein [Clostridium botulinum CFSAN001627]APC83576.1 hypothetical protein NPD12_1488 [Clostridium botulinum]AXG95356.1 hypothetical protein AGE31_06580 [Clostridium botulinum]EDT83344.1 conserved hypothetical protein [Clostridium botulinum NCTC 2916]MBY6770492.1 hypothetical protein [Clostridium botulinum]